MKLIVGLGNPGAKYARNRHNIGFLALDAIAGAQGAAWRSKFNGQLAEARFPTGRALLLKPDTFMNLSGDSVQAAMSFHKIAPRDLIVLHDELDLPPGKVRPKLGGGHAGHNGLRSIIGHIGADFARIRLGIGHPGDKTMVSNYVLSDFAKSDDEWLDPLLDAVARAAPDLAAGDVNRFASLLGQTAAQKPPRPSANAPARPAPEPEAKAKPEPEASPLQRLIDRFR